MENKVSCGLTIWSVLDLDRSVGIIHVSILEWKVSNEISPRTIKYRQLGFNTSQVALPVKHHHSRELSAPHSKHSSLKKDEGDKSEIGKTDLISVPNGEVFERIPTSRIPPKSLHVGMKPPLLAIEETFFI